MPRCIILPSYTSSSDFSSFIRSILCYAIDIPAFPPLCHLQEAIFSMTMDTWKSSQPSQKSGFIQWTMQWHLHDPLTDQTLCIDLSHTGRQTCWTDSIYSLNNHQP